MVAVVIAFPAVVTGSIDKAVTVDENAVNEMLNNMPMDNGEEPAVPAAEGTDKPVEDGMPKPPAEAEEDPMKALKLSLIHI